MWGGGAQEGGPLPGSDAWPGGTMETVRAEQKAKGERREMVRERIESGWRSALIRI